MEDINNPQNQKPGPTCSEYEHDQRVEQVRKWLCEFHPRMDIVKWGSERWNVSTRAVDEYISKANAIMRTLTRLSAEESLADQIAKHEHLLQEAYKNSDRRTITAELKQLDFLKGLGKTNVDVTSNGESIGKIIVEIINKPTTDEK
jgi:hypothetical protein